MSTGRREVGRLFWLAEPRSDFATASGAQGNRCVAAACQTLSMDLSREQVLRFRGLPLADFVDA